MEQILELLLKAGPYTVYVIAAALFYIGYRLDSIAKSQERGVEAQLAQTTATEALTSALKVLGNTVGDVAHNQTDIIRMMERFHSAEAERHGSNVQTLAMIMNMVTRKD